MNKEITIRLAKTKDFPAIQSLQEKNLASAVRNIDKPNEGFLSTTTTIEMLEEIRSEIGLLCAIDENNELVGYEFPISLNKARAISFFDEYLDAINGLTFHGELLTNSNAVIEGQICIKNELKGTGIAKLIHTHFKKLMADKYKYIIAGISVNNPRSLHAHKKKLGFEMVTEFFSKKIKWYILVQNV